MAIPYVGGKSKIAAWVVGKFPADYRRRTYVEVFGGAAWVLLKKDASSNEVYNDLDKNLVNMFLTIRDRFEEFKAKAAWTLTGRAIWEAARARLQGGVFEDEIDRAVAYAVSKTQSFAGHGKTYGYSILPDRSNRAWNAFHARLESIRDRFLLVNVECLGYEELIAKYDGPDTLFYLDPPYVGVEGYYAVPFGLEDHRNLARILKGIQGKFALSYYPNPEISRLYKGFKVCRRDVVKSSYGVTRTSKARTRPRAVELLITNYTPTRWLAQAPRCGLGLPNTVAGEGSPFNQVPASSRRRFSASASACRARK